MSIGKVLAVLALVAFGCGCAPLRPRSLATAGASQSHRRALQLLTQQVTQAWIDGDAGTVEHLLAESFIDVKEGVRVTRPDLVALVGTFRCTVPRWRIFDSQVANVTPDVSVLSYSGTFDGVCTSPGGQSIPLLSPTRSATVFVRQGREWRAVFHSENALRRLAPRRNASGAPDRDLSVASLLAPASPATAGGHADAFVQLHLSVIDALKRRATDDLARMVTPEVSVVGPAGQWWKGRGAALRFWPSTFTCLPMDKAGGSQAIAQSVAPAVELLTVRISPCGIRADADRYHSALYVLSGGNWKLGFVFDSAAP